MNSQEIKEELKLSYKDLVVYLILKHAKAKHIFLWHALKRKNS